MLALLLACADDEIVLEPRAPAFSDSGAPREEAGSAENEDTDCSDLYDPSELMAFEVEISDEEWAALEADYANGVKEYHPVVFRWRDEVVPDAMIRLKGNPNFSWHTDKMQFVIAFNEANPDGRFHGQRKISLDASWYEPTGVRDRVSWAVMNRSGQLPTLCTNSATLTINGAYYGLYTNIEYLDHEWLERNFGDDDATGTLWKYGHDPVANAENADGSAIERLWRTTDPDELATLGDVDEWMAEWAAEIVLGDDDGYWCCDHNYYLYEHPTRGILFVPWDMDDNFDVQAYDVDPVDGYYAGLFQQPQFHAVVEDPVWGPRFVDKVAELNAAMDPALALADVDAFEAQIAEALETDPHRSTGWEEHLGAMERMRAWIPARHAFLESWVACQRGETTDADGDNAPVCEDPNDGDAGVFPGAVEVCNGVDDDADGWVDDDAACDDCARHDLDDRHYLFCRWPRTWSEARSNCQARGGDLAPLPETYGEYYMVWFYAWPVLEEWWTDGSLNRDQCPAWDEANWSFTYTACADAHPSICALP
ncbi:MAG: CotH kinase family protein [Myxococcota bacterium]